jgi:hypothetical protein
MSVLAVLAGTAVGGAVYGGYGALGGLFATAGALNMMRATSAVDDGSGERGSSMLAALVDFGIVGYVIYHQYRDHGRRAED